MAFDNLKLEKGLYTTGKSFTQALESIDPSENYIGTQYEGLDAYQRQLKRFDIKVSGNDSDSVAKFFNTTDSAALFPEYVSRSVRQGLTGKSVLDRIVTTTTNINSMDYRSIESVNDESDFELANVAEGAYIPQTLIKTKDKLTKLHKRGRMLVASYEAIKFQKLDLFTVTLKQIGSYIAISQLNDLLDEVGKSNYGRVQVSNEITYNDLVNLWAMFDPYEFTTMLTGNDVVAKFLKMPEFKDAQAGLNFHGTGNMITPLGTDVITVNCLHGENMIVGLDNNYAIEKIQVGDIITDFDKLIDRQLERATITAIAGFSCICPSAINILEKV